MLLRAALLSRAISVLLIYVASRALPSFDDSAKAILGERSQLEGFVRWDTLYFIRIAQDGYTREQEHAFQPGIAMVLRWSGRQLQAIRGADQLDIGDLVIGGVVAANLATIAATFVLHRCVAIAESSYARRLTLAITHDAKFSRLTALLYCIPPSPPTLSVPYTEPFYALFTFSGMLMVERRRPLSSALLFALATSFRASGILNAGFIVWYCLIARRAKLMSSALAVR